MRLGCSLVAMLIGGEDAPTDTLASVSAECAYRIESRPTTAWGMRDVLNTSPVGSGFTFQSPSDQNLESHASEVFVTRQE